MPSGHVEIRQSLLYMSFLGNVPVKPALYVKEIVNVATLLTGETLKGLFSAVSTKTILTRRGLSVRTIQTPYLNQFS